MFLKAVECQPDVIPKAMMNLALVYNSRGNFLAQSGDLAGAKAAALDTASYLDQAKPLFDEMVSSGKADGQLETYIDRYRPLKVQSHRLLGQLYAGMGDMEAGEKEFRTATENFPDEPLAWKMLHRILDLQGKKEEAEIALNKLLSLGS
jgi:tetratricopeptide (TPR) repeat protein